MRLEEMEESGFEEVGVVGVEVEIGRGRLRE